MSILKLKPACKEAIWGGQRLRQEFGLEHSGGNIAEAWVLSCHPSAPSVIENGPYAGQTLQACLQAEGSALLGSNGMQFEQFPLLVKLIDANKPLSVQVHPSNAYALEHEHQYGKTEMWYILDAEPDSFLYYGFCHALDPQELARRIAEDTLTEVLNAVPVEKGDCFFIPSGTVHAIGSGILLAEIQQNSDVTYRLYDYGRVDADGNRRPLHTEKAKQVCTLAPPTSYDFGQHLACCEYFTVDRLCGSFEDVSDERSFVSLLVLDGSGLLEQDEEKMPLKKGDSLFLPAGSGNYRVTGACELLRTRVGQN